MANDNGEGLFEDWSMKYTCSYNERWGEYGGKLNCNGLKYRLSMTM